MSSTMAPAAAPSSAGLNNRWVSARLVSRIRHVRARNAHCASGPWRLEPRLPPLSAFHHAVGRASETRSNDERLSRCQPHDVMHGAPAEVAGRYAVPTGVARQGSGGNRNRRPSCSALSDSRKALHFVKIFAVVSTVLQCTAAVQRCA